VAIAFAGLGLFTSLAGVFLAGTLHRTALSLAGGTVFAVFAGAVSAQFISIRWSRRAVLSAGMGLQLVGLGLVVLAAWLPSPSLAAYLIGGFVSGSGAGLTLKGGFGTVMMLSEPARRAESAAGVLLAGYLGLSVPAIGVGVALQEVSTKVTLLGFAVFVASVIITAAPIMLRNQQRGGGDGASPRVGGAAAAPGH
jgi:hypothetical protein